MHIRIIIGIAALSSIGLVVACSSSTTTTATTGNDGGDKAEGGGDTDGGSGACGRILDGKYDVTNKATVGPDVDASGQTACKDTTGTVTSNLMDAGFASGDFGPGCTATLSGDGCDFTVDCKSDQNGQTATSHYVEHGNPDGTLTVTATYKTVEDDGGAPVFECTTVGTGVRQP